ncbi:hypothetical protein CFOL_v3_23003 [Cephalotus follicularis]|uniref:Uncharacterized protein n=1 Tax=Cephalotus follicularis TaxID=3775 RepID=A0A1Q3CHD8_CEPFO|nr:hypothetical protein CFOL_v3_23003 [Cephalotus follicularis]
MKFDNEQVLCHSTLARRPDSKPFEYHGKAMDSTGLKSENGVMKDNQKRVLSFLKGKEGNAECLPCERNESKLDCPVVANYSTNDNESFEKHSVFYFNRSVMKCELPELILCYKESPYHVVKDICINEDVPSKDKNLFFESGVDEKSVCTFPPDMDQNIESTEGKPFDMPIPVAMKASAENDSDKDINDKYDIPDLMPIGEVQDDATDKNANDIPKQKISLGDMLSMEKLHSENTFSKSCDVVSKNAEQLSVQSSSEKTVASSLASLSTSDESNNSGNRTEESNNDSEDLTLASPTLVSATKESDSGRDEMVFVSPAIVSASEESANSSFSNDLSYNSKVETGSITFDFNSGAPAASDRKECPQITESECLDDTQSSSRLEDADIQLVTSQTQHSHGESSFSTAGPISGSIIYSGPIAYSGSVSLRSDSSTTSTRSFAFPVLQSEWNSSPVRMAKADRRHYRKHRGWRQGLLCCRF